MIVDANPIVSACLGRSRSLFEALIAQGADLFVPEHQMREAWMITSRQGPIRGLDPEAIFRWTNKALLPVAADLYDGFEAEAKARLQVAGQRDWPLVALALASGDDIWSNDVDLFGTGVPVWNTHNIIRNVSRTSPRMGLLTGAEHG